MEAGSYMRRADVFFAVPQKLKNLIQTGAADVIHEDRRLTGP